MNSPSFELLNTIILRAAEKVRSDLEAEGYQALVIVGVGIAGTDTFAYISNGNREFQKDAANQIIEHSVEPPDIRTPYGSGRPN